MALGPWPGSVPDLEAHCAIRSARIMGMDPAITADEIIALCHEGIGKFPDNTDLYICPLFYPSGGFVIPDPASNFVLTLEESYLPPATGFTACLSPFRRPAIDMAPTV